MKELLGFRCLSPDALQGRPSWKDGLTEGEIKRIQSKDGKYVGPRNVRNIPTNTEPTTQTVPDMDPDYMEHQFDRPENQ